jgi:hypothetical protein
LLHFNLSREATQLETVTLLRMAASTHLPSDNQRHHDQSRRRTVCLFGLSADPPTGAQGHVGIVRALQQMNEWDEIWVLPVYRHAFMVRCSLG